MNCRLARKTIDSTAPGERSAPEWPAVLAHCEACLECRRLLDSAAITTSLIKAWAAAQVEPSPFFSTRVVAAIRERAAATARQSASRLWRSGRAVVVSMVAVVAILLALNLILPKPAVDYGATRDVAQRQYSVDRVVMGDSSGASDESLTSGQVLDTVFGQGDSYGID